MYANRVNRPDMPRAHCHASTLIWKAGMMFGDLLDDVHHESDMETIYSFPLTLFPKQFPT